MSTPISKSLYACVIRKAVSFLSLVCCLIASAQSNYRVYFDHDRYDIKPGDSFAVGILIDPVPPPGLFSFGVRLQLSATNAKVINVAGITPAAGLAFNGVRGVGAAKTVTKTYAAIKGTADVFARPFKPSTGSLLATFMVTDLGAGSYPLSLQLYNTLGLTEQVFVDGAGQTLDSLITFGAATVSYLTLARANGLDAGRSLTPLSLGAELSGGALQMTFGTAPGTKYVIEWADSLMASQWHPLEPIDGDGSRMSIPLAIDASARFYRLRIHADLLREQSLPQHTDDNPSNH